MKALRYLLTPALVLAIAVPLMAAGKEKRGEKKQGGEKGQRAQVLPAELLKELNLTPEQQTKVDAILEEVKGKFQEIHTEMDGILTAEQKAARQEAEKAAKAAGKTGEEARESVEAAVTLTPEQQEKMDKVKKDMAAIQQDVREKLTPILTPEQQEILKAKMKRGGGEGKARGGKKQKQQ